MKTFLEHVAEDIIRKYGTDLSRLVVVFPNKRASLFLNEALVRLAGRPVWSPAYITISQLFRSQSELTVADPIKLVCDLHRSYIEVTGFDETLDHFYGWGQLLLTDFDDIDKHMAPDDKVFANLRDYREFDDVSYLSQEQRDVIRKFFSNFTDDHNTLLKERFLRLWSRMGDIYHNDTLTLDRGLVTVGSDRFVHLVVVGMTPMGYAFAATAAQLCHFPNFDESAPRPIRTRITFVDPRANELMDCFKASYPGIFDLSHVRYIEQPGAWLQGVPQRSLGDFVDVEWQFVKGNISSEWIRDMLSDCAADSRQVLSVALCGGDSARNLAEAYRLPRQLYPLPDSNNSSPLTPVVYVYQPDDSSLVQTVQNEVLRFHNVVPFGFSAKGFDPLHSLRIAAAKRINYLYQKENSGKVFTSMPADEALLNELWRQLSSAEKTAALLAANATNTFIRSFGLSRTTLADHLSDDALVESFAAVDHARRNMACLLAGYSAMPADQRARLNSALQSADNSEREEATIQSKYSKCMLFVDKDITPYALLPENLKQYYRAIVRNIHVVC